MRPAAEAPVAVREAVVLTHSEPAGTGTALGAAARAAAEAGCTLRTTEAELAKHPDPPEGIEVGPALPERPDLCLVLGGDGTILTALRRYAATGVPVFGINYGTIGFLAAAEATELETGLEQAFAGGFETLTLPALTVSGRELAFNDVSLTRRPHGRIAELSYLLEGREVGHVRCDGLVASTPVGSTGYNLANGGPILAWGVEGYAVSFVSPHTLTARALVVAPDDVLTVRNAAARDGVEVAIDGEDAGELGCGEELEVAFRHEVGCLAQLPGANFYRRIREKFGHLAH